MTPEMRRAVRPWVGPLARVGYAAKGVVYFLIGGLALLAAVGQGGSVSGSEGAVRTIGEQPFGKVLLIAAAIGLAAHVVWRLLQATLNLEDERGAKGVFKRIAYISSALAYGALAVLAVRLAGGHGEAGRGRSTKGRVAQVLNAPLGEVLVGGVGAVLVGYGISQLYAATTGRFQERLDGNGGPHVWGVLLGRLGLAARGIVFGIIGYHLVKAAIDSRAGETKDMGGVLRELASQPSGPLMLGGVAAGLAAYGLYMMVCARYARIAGGSR